MIGTPLYNLRMISITISSSIILLSEVSYTNYKIFPEYGGQTCQGLRVCSPFHSTKKGSYMFIHDFHNLKNNNSVKGFLTWKAWLNHLSNSISRKKKQESHQAKLVNDKVKTKTNQEDYTHGINFEGSELHPRHDPSYIFNFSCKNWMYSITWSLNIYQR